VIEDILNRKEAMTPTSGNATVNYENETAKDNANLLAEDCLQIISYPYDQNSPSPDILERSIRIIQECFEFLHLLFSFGLITVSTDPEKIHNYKLLQARFLSAMGANYAREDCCEDAVAYLAKAEEVAEQNLMDVEFWNIQTSATLNLALAYQQLNELSKAQFVLEDLYEKLA
jgi:hypothetical protein